MESVEYIKEFWSMANSITGFSIVQSIAAAIAFGTNLKSLQDSKAPIKGVLILATILFLVLYSAGVWACYEMASIPKSKSANEVWIAVTMARIGAIWVFGMLPIFALMANGIFARFSRKSDEQAESNN